MLPSKGLSEKLFFISYKHKNKNDRKGGAIAPLSEERDLGNDRPEKSKTLHSRMKSKAGTSTLETCWTVEVLFGTAVLTMGWEIG